MQAALTIKLPVKASRRAMSAAILALAALGGSPSPSRAACGLLADFNRAMSVKSMDEVRRVEQAILIDQDCLDETQKVQNQRIDFTLRLLDDPNGPLRTPAQREAALKDAAMPAVSWRAAERLADFLLNQRQFHNALIYYNEAIRRAGDKDITLQPLTDAQKNELKRRTAAARALEADDDGGAKMVRVEDFQPIRDISGKIGSVYAPVLRTVVATPVPTPINFVVGKDVFTPAGQNEVAILASVLEEQKPATITLAGHTDPSGTDEYNLALSELRVRAVANYLANDFAKHGVTIQIHTIAKGKREPFDVRVLLPFVPSRDEEYALNRRVEMLATDK